MHLTSEVERAAVAHAVDRGRGKSDARVELNLQLELEILLYDEYKYVLPPTMFKSQS